MGTGKIVWSHKAQIRLFEILEFYAKRNKSTAYSKRLYKQFNKELSFLINQPEIGIKTELDSVRGLIIEGFILFYEVSEKYIIVHTVWDCKQNPDDLKIK